MQADRSEYEIWIADWLAGNLDRDRKKQFDEFLAANPALKEEAESLLLTAVVPDNISFPRKKLLKKNPEDFTASHVEYLSVAYLENDLSPEQTEELNICLAKNPELRLLSESVRKTKLSPPLVSYNYKKHLKKKTRAGKILRLSSAGLSAAAAVTLLVMSSVFIVRYMTEKKNISGTADLIVADGQQQVLRQEQTEGQELPLMQEQSKEQQQALMQEQKEGKLLPPEQEQREGKLQQAEEQPLPPEQERPEGELPLKQMQTEKQQPSPETGLPEQEQLAEQRLPERQLLAGIIRIEDLPRPGIEIIQKPGPGTLMTVSIPFREPPYDGRNGFTRLLARTFREKILRDDSGNDAPIRSYEIASAGINGISRMFGLEMSLTGITDSQGDLKSLYFSSRLVKFNAPVKKDESLQ